MVDQQPEAESRFARWGLVLVEIVLLYIFSSGPVLGLAFWLREATGWDGFYAAMLLYYPLLAMGHDNVVMAYIEWWVVNVFNTVGPG